MTLALLLTMTAGAWAQGVTASKMNVPDSWQNGSSIITADDLPGFVAVTEGEAQAWAGAPKTGGAILIYGFSGSDLLYVDFQDGAYNKSWSGTLNHSNLYTIKNAGATIYYTCDIEIITNAEEGEKTFTEASFKMPAYEATAEYELVRDMSYKVAFDGVPAKARVAKNSDGKYNFAEAVSFKLLDNIDANNPKDISNAEGIAFMVGEIEALDMEGDIYYRLDEETLVPLADFLTDTKPGLYVIRAQATSGDYDGTLSSGMIELYQGYEVTIPAGEYITYYRDEPLKLDDADKESIELYTVSSVTATEAVLSDPFDAAPANTPLLVYNKNTEEAKTILLIPCNEPDLALTVADAFKGTLDAKVFSKDDMEAAVYYVCTGKAFAPVKSAGTIAANRCWLEISTAAPSNARKIVSGNATGIDSMVNGQWSMDNYYDMQGRKVEKPVRGGIYIKNGKKVVIK